jgi:hypothetical protein
MREIGRNNLKSIREAPKHGVLSSGIQTKCLMQLDLRRSPSMDSCCNLSFGHSEFHVRALDAAGWGEGQVGSVASWQNLNIGSCISKRLWTYLICERMTIYLNPSTWDINSRLEDRFVTEPPENSESSDNFPPADAYNSRHADVVSGWHWLNGIPLRTIEFHYLVDLINTDPLPKMGIRHSKPRVFPRTIGAHRKINLRH